MSIRSEKFIFNVILYYVPLRSSVEYDLNILNFLTCDLAVGRGSVSRILVDSSTEEKKY